MDKYLALFAALFYLATLILYTPAPWYKSWVGRVIWSLLLSMTLIMGLATFTLWDADFTWKPYLRITIYVLVFLSSVVVFASVNAAFRVGRKNVGTGRD